MVTHNVRFAPRQDFSVRFLASPHVAVANSAGEDNESEKDGMQADCSATAQSLEEEIAAKQAELADVTAEQQAREVQATDLDRQIAEAERRLQVSLLNRLCSSLTCTLLPLMGCINSI